MIIEINEGKKVHLVGPYYENMQLYLNVYKCSFKQCYVTVMTWFL